jgi:hypothetical protein
MTGFPRVSTDLAAISACEERGGLTGAIAVGADCA